MPDQTAPPTPAQAPATVATPPQPRPVAAPFTPIACREEGMREALLEHLKTFKPDGNPSPKQLENVRAHAINSINELDPELNFVTLTIETQIRPAARQTMVLAIGKTVHE